MIYKNKRYFLFLCVLILIFCVGCHKDSAEENETKDISQNYSDEKPKEEVLNISLPELKVQYDADFILYYVSCGSAQLNSNSEMSLLPLGLFQSVSDQEFSKDTKGVSWGYIKKDWMTAEYDSLMFQKEIMK